jgi:erythromycin esterase-like protein
MDQDAHKLFIDMLNEAARPLDEKNNQYDELLEKIGDSRFVLIGEASHGTHEFYQKRIEITRALIEKKGFMAVAVEGDWPDSYTINRYIKGSGKKEDSLKALNDFTRFPLWMWRNTTIPPFIEWLRDYNDKLNNSALKVGFYGLDLYSLPSSMEAVITYLNKVDPEAANRARLRFECFDHMTIDPQSYGYLTNAGVKKDCIKETIEQMLDMQHHALQYVKKDGILAEDEYFYAIQNARVVKDAEEYYRSMFKGHVRSWNLRDHHMAETVSVLENHLEKRFSQPAKIIIWAHNSHVGDARATEMSMRGEYNIGQLIRERHEMETYLIGFSTYDGTVTAASNWDAPAETKMVVPGLIGSYEDLFHQVKYSQFLLDLRNNEKVNHYLHIPRLYRAIGVIYRPETERDSHYFFTRLPYQYDSIIHLDRTSALKPLDA